MNHVYRLKQPLKIITRESTATIDSSLEKQIDKIWQQQSAKRSLTDNHIVSVNNWQPQLLEISIRPYREFLATLISPELKTKLKIQPLAVSGILHCESGYLLARRSAVVSQLPNYWECAPSGSVDACNCDNPLQQLYDELEEEINIKLDETTAVDCFVLIEDTTTGVYDLGISLTVTLDAEVIAQRFQQGDSNEYSELKIIPDNAMLDFFNTNSVIQTSIVLYETLVSEHCI